MASKHFNAPSRASSADPGGGPRSGVVHVNVRHSSRYTVVGNHLAQHRELSLLAIGLAVHIQSLPVGARIGIKLLTARFPESEHRIAAALRELESYGYLERTRERLPSGKVVTRTVSYNQPGAEPTERAAPEPPAPRPPAAPREAAARPLPQPRSSDPARHHTAVGLLTDLHRHDPRLLLAERDVRRLAPGVEAWLEGGAGPGAVQRTLAATVPEDLQHPAGLLAYRLTELMPPFLPTAPPPARPDPLQNCDNCDRAFRAPSPGRCRDCRPDLKEAA
ncbi:helix-turn-helix domain-containing protein [Streptomyces sp. H27-C3]|uniref:helix-turn-helix domain-containing protein n=1 Tax=Streptomyces sp. H27-C3 TaxID=3046305 RepID=UPI0024B9E1B0|nr:helix-turn-helix domain-containing protein [Streptomyces sp. H27-C3]MDJ0465210.1 helix-turn-helix domain-containing protein [Streptomyces sp. H27-C3]